MRAFHLALLLGVATTLSDAFSFRAPLRSRAAVKPVHWSSSSSAAGLRRSSGSSNSAVQHLGRASRRGSSLRMVDTNVIIGVAVGLAGLGGGIGLVAFAEGQAERFEERGSDAMSDETRSKLASQFMEDVEMQAVGLDDTISKMEAAMAKRQGIDVEELDKEVTVTEKLDDGW